MDERNCYLVIDKVDKEERGKSWGNINDLFKRQNLSLNKDGWRFLADWCLRSSDGTSPLSLDMFHMTASEAEKEIEHLKKQGIHARIQYHAAEINTPSSTPLPSAINANEIISDINKLKQYLKDLYTLEKELFCSQQSKEKAFTIINQLGIPADIRIKGTKSTLGNKLFNAIFWGIFRGVVGLIIGVIIGMLIESLTNSSGIAMIAIAISTLVGIGLGISEAKSGDTSENYEYEKSMKLLEDDKQRVAQEKALIPTYRKQETLFAQNIASCTEILNQLYSADIIFPKYRNLIAISQIYEYFMSGRCTQLEGHEGAYNIFETEIRQNIIISQLNTVIDNLEEIKNTQYMIYDAIQESNQLLANIASNTSAIAYNTSVIAENSAICARYSHY